MVRDTNPNDGTVAGEDGTGESVSSDLDEDDIDDDGGVDPGIDTRGLPDDPGETTTIAGEDAPSNPLDEAAVVDRDDGSTRENNSRTRQEAADRDDGGDAPPSFGESAGNVAAARALEGRGGPPRPTGDSVRDGTLGNILRENRADSFRDPALVRGEAQARLDARRDRFGLSRDDEQFGDLDFSAGLGGPGDEVEQTVDAAPGAVSRTTDRVPNEVLDVGRRGLETTSPVFRGVNSAIEAGDRATGGQTSRSVNRGLRDAPVAVADVPGQALELAELGVFTTDATVAAGGSEEEFDRRARRVGEAAAGQARLAGQFAQNNPVRFGTGLVASSVAEAGAVGAVTRAGSAGRLASRGATPRRAAVSETASTVTPDSTPDVPDTPDAVGDLPTFLADDRGQADLTGGGRSRDGGGSSGADPDLDLDDLPDEIGGTDPESVRRVRGRDRRPRIDRDRTEAPSDRAVRSLLDDATPDEPQPSGRQVQELDERLPGDDLRSVRADPNIGPRTRRQVDPDEARAPEFLAASTPEAGGDLAERLDRQQEAVQSQLAAQQSALDSRLDFLQDTLFETDLAQDQRFDQRFDQRQAQRFDQRQDVRQDQRLDTEQRQELRQDQRLNLRQDLQLETDQDLDLRFGQRQDLRQDRRFDPFEEGDDRRDDRFGFGLGTTADDRVFDTGVAQSVDEALSRFDEAEQEAADGGAFDFDFSEF
jgi:hypothetical protein